MKISVRKKSKIPQAKNLAKQLEKKNSRKKRVQNPNLLLEKHHQQSKVTGQNKTWTKRNFKQDEED